MFINLVFEVERKISRGPTPMVETEQWFEVTPAMA